MMQGFHSGSDTTVCARQEVAPLPEKRSAGIEYTQAVSVEMHARMNSDCPGSLSTQSAYIVLRVEIVPREMGVDSTMSNLTARVKCRELTSSMR